MTGRLRAAMAAGRNPFASAELDTLVESACAVAQARAGEWAVRSDPFAAEIFDDPEVREWAAGLIPGDILQEGEFGRRPFGLEPGDGPYRCAGCGTIGVGRHVFVVDHMGWLAGASATVSELLWCGPCMLGALGGAA